MNHLRQFNLKTSAFLYSILFISIAYIIFEYCYIPYRTLTVDEFVFARQIYDYLTHLPYHDFPPYKGVLGYYLLSIPMYFSHTLLDPLFYIKDEIALINAGFILLSSYWAAQLLDKRAVLLAMLLVICSQLFLVYAVDLRVDMLASWGCLFAALSILQHRLRLAGVLLSIAFLISQKAGWYFLALNGAMTLCWVLFPAPIYSWRSLFTFNIAFTLPIILYIIGWSCVSSISAVLSSLFYEAYIQAGIDWYMGIYLTLWMVALTHGALLFFLWPLTFLSLFEKNIQTAALQRRTFIISFASIALLLFINYKQPFHYNFVFTIPAFFLLYADFAAWLLLGSVDNCNSRCKTSNTHLPAPSFFFIFTMACYTYCIWLVIYIFSLPVINHLLILFPILACAFLYTSNKYPRIRLLNLAFIFFIFIGMGILYPLYLSVTTSHHMNGTYQQTMIRLTADLIKDDGDYLSGVPYLYQKDQPIEGMKNLISPAIGYLSTPSEKLKLLLLPSLFITPTTQEKILEDLETAPVKVIIANYRIHGLPAKITHYINQHYQHFYGSLYIYAPQIMSTQLNFYLKFSAYYRLDANTKASITIDGKRIRAGQIIYLNKGDHLTDANQTYHLVLVPKINPARLDPLYKKDRWKK